MLAAGLDSYGRNWQIGISTETTTEKIN